MEILQVIENTQNIFCVKFLTYSIEDSHGMSLAEMQAMSRTIFALESWSYGDRAMKSLRTLA